MPNRCYFCKGEVVQQNATIDYRWGNDLVVINDVPCGVCTQCGEKYLTSDTYKKLESMAENKNNIKERLTIDVLSFEKNAA